MTKLKTSALTILIALGVGTPVLMLKNANDRLRTEMIKSTEQSGMLKSLREENQRLAQLKVDSDELARLRKEHAELTQLRGEVASLRHLLGEGRTHTAPPAQQAASEPDTASERLVPTVESYKASFDVTLEHGESLASGGWELEPGRRGLVFITPEIVKPGDETVPAHVMIRTKFIDVPERFLVDRGMEQLLVNGTESALGHVLPHERAQELLQELENASEVKVLSSPTVMTLDGRQAQVMAVKNETVDGVTRSIGPRVNLTPSVSTESGSVNLEVDAEWKQFRDISTPANGR